MRRRVIVAPPRAGQAGAGSIAPCRGRLQPWAPSTAWERIARLFLPLPECGRPGVDAASQVLNSFHPSNVQVPRRCPKASARNRPGPERGQGAHPLQDEVDRVHVAKKNEATRSIPHSELPPRRRRSKRWRRRSRRKRAPYSSSAASLSSQSPSSVCPPSNGWWIWR